MKATPRTDPYFRLYVHAKSGRQWLVCKTCGQMFNVTDRTGKRNIIGRLSHVQMHVREVLERKKETTA